VHPLHPTGELVSGVRSNSMTNEIENGHDLMARSMSSRAEGFSSDERSPVSSPSTFARMARRRILAERVFGSSETNFTWAGLKAFPSSSVMAFMTSAVNSGVRSVSGDTMQKHQTVSPLTGSGTPTAAHSTTEG